MGGTVTDYRLFLFAGGWIRYARAEPYSALEGAMISSAGIAVEVLLAALALLVARHCRRGGLARVGLIAYAAGNAVHATYYLAVGIHYGIGDGVAIRDVLGPGPIRAGAALGAAALAIIVSFAGARLFFAELWPQLRRFRRAWLAGTAAMIVAVLLHGGLALASLHLERDPAYAGLMRPSAEREADRAVARLRRDLEASGRRADPQQLEAARQAVVRRERPWPLRPLLAVAVIVAVIVGARRRPRFGDCGPWTRKEIVILGGLSLAAIVLVWLLRSP